MPKGGQTWDPELCTRSPLFAPFLPWLETLARRPSWPTHEDYTRIVSARRRERDPLLGPLRFEPASPRPRRFRRKQLVKDDLYDARIAQRGSVPCVPESYHDLFNALMFAAFPRAKQALHDRQYRALERWLEPGAARLPSRRTREQDALTVFDEGGSVVIVSEAFEREWRTSEVPLLLSSTDQDAGSLVPFGHALLEHVFDGRFELRSCAMVAPLDGSDSESHRLDWIDDRLTALLRDDRRFAEPGGDGVVRIDESGRPWLEPQTRCAHHDGFGARS